MKSFGLWRAEVRAEDGITWACRTIFWPCRASSHCVHQREIGLCRIHAHSISSSSLVVGGFWLLKLSRDQDGGGYLLEQASVVRNRSAESEPELEVRNCSRGSELESDARAKGQSRSLESEPRVEPGYLKWGEAGSKAGIGLGWRLQHDWNKARAMLGTIRRRNCHSHGWMLWGTPRLLLG